MSRSANTEIINPAKKFIEWKSDKKCFSYWDKQAEKNVDIKLPFRFLVLDTLSTIKGYSDADSSGFWSNEVRDIKTETLVVKTKKGVCAKGLYENIINGRDMTGAKYCQSVYIMIKEGKENIIANLQIHGSALGQWIEFRKKNKIFECAIEVKTFVEGSKGKTVYNMPVFQKITATEDSNQQATKFDVELQEYLSAYFKNKNVSAETENIEHVVRTSEPELVDKGQVKEEPEHGDDDKDDLPF